LTKLQARGRLSRALCARLLTTLLKDEQTARDNHVLACNFAKHLVILKYFTDRLTNKPVLIWLSSTPPHLKYVATLPCYLSLMSCFLTLMFSQGSVATYVRRDVILIISLVQII